MKVMYLIINGEELTVCYNANYRDVVEADTPFGPVVRQEIDFIEIINVTPQACIDYTVIEEVILKELLYAQYLYKG